jgi:hypothetical protein
MVTPAISGDPQAARPQAAESPPRPLTSPENDLWIFRAGGKTVSGPALLAELSHAITGIGSHPDTLLDVLILAGQLEAALADAGSADACEASLLTDQLACNLLGAEPPVEGVDMIGRIRAPELIRISPPEGFTYYALHPGDFSRIAARLPSEPRSCAIVGIRSIGTTLSAMAAAGLKAEGRQASRITVRPTGHPYSRTTEFRDQERRWIEEQVSCSSQFLIVDEGPGRSGSTFLSVAEALVRAGVAQERITMVGSRQPNPETLYATEAASRWRAFRFLAVCSSVSTKYESYRYIGGGEWRNIFFADPSDWPESWTQMERLKFIAPDSRTLVKFEGMGAVGREARERAFVLAEAGFSPPVMHSRDGFLEYHLIPGRRLRAADLSTRLLERLAGYCAFRAAAFRSREPVSAILREMLQFNLGQEFGVELPLAEDELVPDMPVLCDGRMQPYEWILTDNDRLLKTDGVSHGDDHFFPGPCDVAWDLAGAAVEWELGSDGLQYLLEQFRRRSAIDVSNSIPLYQLAYSIFRLGFAKMAIPTLQGDQEELRLTKAYEHYRRKADQLISTIIARRLKR